MTLPPGTIPTAPSCGCMLCDFGLVPFRDAVGSPMVHTAYRDGAVIGSVACTAPPADNRGNYGKVVILSDDLPAVGIAVQP